MHRAGSAVEASQSVRLEFSLRWPVQEKIMNRAMPQILAIVGGLLLTTGAPAAVPDCSGVDSWATASAAVHLKNAKLIRNERLDFAKTRTDRIASERIGPDLYRQVHHIVFTEKTGRQLEVIVINDASTEECSMSGVQVFVISRSLGGP